MLDVEGPSLNFERAFDSMIDRLELNRVMRDFEALVAEAVAEAVAEGQPCIIFDSISSDVIPVVNWMRDGF
jgi:hypothetical protein